MVDRGKLQARIELLGSYRAQLEELRDMTPEEYVDEEAFAGRYLIQAAAQICIDLANHLIASEGWRAPRNFPDSFTVLEERGVLGADLTSGLQALAGLRNRLVHLYDEVDDYFVHEALQHGLDDLDGFARVITTFATRSDGG